jgi:DNA topoisomerase-1
MVQIGTTDDGDEKPRFAGLRAGQRLETVTLAEALELFKLPRTLGEYEGEVIKANTGRFGPYVQHGKVFVSLKAGDDPFSVDLDRAIELIHLKREADAQKVMLRLTEEIQVLKGQWGPYLKMHGENVKLPKDINVQSLTLEDCQRLYEEHLAKPKKSGRGAAKSSAKTADAPADKKTGKTSSKTTGGGKGRSKK